MVHTMQTQLASFIEMYTAISRKVVGKETSKCTREDLKVVWVFTGILHIGLEEIYKFVFFARGEFVFPLKRPIFVALLLLSHVFE